MLGYWPLIVFAVFIVTGFYMASVRIGREKERLDALKKGVDNANKTRARRAKRSRDSNATVRKRMSPYVRK